MENIIKYPVVNEKTLRMMRENNSLVFVVDKRYGKPEVKEALKELFGLQINKINSLIDVNGNKKVFVKLSDEQIALDIATNLGLM